MDAIKGTMNVLIRHKQPPQGKGVESLSPENGQPLVDGAQPFAQENGMVSGMSHMHRMLRSMTRCQWLDAVPAGCCTCRQAHKGGSGCCANRGPRGA